MLHENDLYKSFESIDDEILKRSEETAKKNSKPVWVKWGVVAACLVAATVIGVFAFGKISHTGNVLGDNTPDEESMYDIICEIKERYRDMSIFAAETSMLRGWPEEYKPIYEKCTSVTFNKKQYQTKTRGSNALFVASVDDSLLGEVIGTCEAVLYDLSTGQKYDQTFDVRQISGVSPDLMIAVEMEGCSYVFNTKSYVTTTLGEMLDAYGLPKTLKLNRFELDNEYYILKEDSYIWEVLSECSEAKFVSYNLENVGEWIDFTATSEALGVYKQVFKVTADGYVWTNISEYGSAFFIGEEAAGKIISYAKEHSKKAGYEPYAYSLIGTLTEIGDGYVLMDDSAVCKNPEDGMVFRISTEDVRIRRYFACGEIEIGELFMIEFSGTLDVETGEIDVGAYCAITTSGSIVVSSDGEIRVLE